MSPALAGEFLSLSHQKAPATSSLSICRLSFKLLLWCLNSSDRKESAYYAGDLGSVPVLEAPLEEGMATHSSIRAWRIPWMEEPGGLP